MGEKSRVTAAVNDELLKAMTATESTLAKLDAGAEIKRLNDRDNYLTVVTQLDELARAVMSATAAAPLLGSQKLDARFRTDAGGSVRDALASATAYLVNEASGIVASDVRTLSNYENANVDKAYQLLSMLHRALVTSVRAMANLDLIDIGRNGVMATLAVASIIAEIASGDTAIDWAEILKTATQS